jgi:hypothetical protein
MVSSLHGSKKGPMHRVQMRVRKVGECTGGGIHLEIGDGGWKGRRLLKLWKVDGRGRGSKYVKLLSDAGSLEGHNYRRVTTSCILISCRNIIWDSGGLRWMMT